MIIKDLIDFPAYTGVEQRGLFIYTPDDYEESDESYPVLYMFDGQNIFEDEDATYGRGWRIHEFLDAYEIPLIVVGVECHRGVHEERMQEYSPYNCSYKKEKYYGHADKTMKWFIKTLKPMIDEEFRTIPDRKHTFIGGSSMGGIIATYCLLRYNRVFSKAISMSPAYYMFKKGVMETINKYPIKKDTVLYTDYGTRDLDAHVAIDVFNKINIKLIEKGVCVTSRIIYNGVHNEANWDSQLIFAINTLMYDLNK